MNWEPIDTAPRTGERMLFWSEAFGFVVVNWPEGHGAGRWEKHDGKWRGYTVAVAAKATHWMPIQEPPNEKTKAGAHE